MSHSRSIIHSTRYFYSFCPADCPAKIKKPRSNLRRLEFTGAGEEIRTLDPRLGKPSLPTNLSKYKPLHHLVQPLFYLGFRAFPFKIDHTFYSILVQYNRYRCTTLHHIFCYVLLCFITPE